MARILRIRGGVVVDEAGRDDRPRRQVQRRGVLVLILPGELPLRNIDQPGPFAVGQRRPGGDLGGEVVRVRIDGEDVDVNRERVLILDHVATLPRRDIDILAAEPHDEGAPGRGGVVEVQPHAGPERLWRAGRQQVELQHQVPAGGKLPREPFRRALRLRAGKPAEKVTVREVGRVVQHPAVARFRILRVEKPRRAGGVDQDPSVVDRAGLARLELHRADPAAGRERRGDRKAPEDVAPGGRHGVRLGHLQDEIGLAKLPPVREPGRRRQLRGIPLGGARLGPPIDRPDLRLAQAPDIPELAMVRRRLPGGHPARHHLLPNGARPGARLVVRQDTERSVLTRPVARGAMLEQDRRHIAAECGSVLSRCPRPGRRRARRWWRSVPPPPARRDGRGSGARWWCRSSRSQGAPRRALLPYRHQDRRSRFSRSTCRAGPAVSHTASIRTGSAM